MNQSSYIAAFLLAGFVLFLAANNRLSEYAAVLWGSPAPPPGEKSAPASSRSSDAGAPTVVNPPDLKGIGTPSFALTQLGQIGNWITGSAGGTAITSTILGWFGL